MTLAKTKVRCHYEVVVLRIYLKKFHFLENYQGDWIIHGKTNQIVLISVTIFGLTSNLSDNQKILSFVLIHIISGYDKIFCFLTSTNLTNAMR